MKLYFSIRNCIRFDSTVRSNCDIFPNIPIFNLCASVIKIIEAEIVFLWNGSNIRVIVNYESIVEIYTVNSSREERRKKESSYRGVGLKAENEST